MNGRTVIENTRRFRDKIKTAGCCFGADISLNDPQITQILSCCGFDFFWIDTEHAAMNIETLAMHVAVANSKGILSMVRVPWNDPVRIKPVLDLGANGIIVPNVKTAEEASLAVRSCLYPPRGIRGYGPRQSADWLSYRIPASEYGRDADEGVFKVVQIESVEGVANVDEILAIPELDSVTLGPIDLSASMGLLGQLDHPDVKEAMRTVMEKTRRAGKILGYPAVFSDDLSPAKELIQKGVQWLSVGQDVSLLRGSSERSLTQLRTFLKA